MLVFVFSFGGCGFVVISCSCPIFTKFVKVQWKLNWESHWAHLDQGATCVTTLIRSYLPAIGSHLCSRESSQLIASSFVYYLNHTLNISLTLPWGYKPLVWKEWREGSYTTMIPLIGHQFSKMKVFLVSSKLNCNY